MSNTEAFQAEIVALVQGVANVGPVYDYPRFFIPPAAIESQLGVADATSFPNRTWRVQFTEVLVGALREGRRTSGDNLEEVVIKVVHYREIFDPGTTAATPSYTAMIALVELMRDAIRAIYETTTAITVDVPQRDEPTLVSIGDTYRCHACTFQVLGHCLRDRT